MSDTTTKRMIEAYFQEAEPTAFFSGMFQARPENFHSSEKVEIDIVRSQEDVSVVVQDLSAGYRMNSEDLYTNKEFKPPIHKEAVPINAHTLIKRVAGQHPFETPNFRANVILKMFSGMRKVEAKIRRSIELQSSQVMQTGAVTLTDSAGNALYSIDYVPKITHFPTSSTSWATATLTEKIADIQNLCDVIRADGLRVADQIIFGESAWENLLQTDGFLSSRFNPRRADLGEITMPETRGEGGIYHGVMTVGSYNLEVWTYPNFYTDPQTGNATKYMDTGKFVVRASSGRMDATFGAIPNIGAELGLGGRLIPEMPSRMSSSGSRMDLFTNMWLSADGEQIFGGVGARPLMIPTAIDTFGCNDTQL